MANIKWLSEDGLKTVWAKVKALVAQETAKKADLVHTHAISDVTGLQDALDAKEIAANRAASIVTSGEGKNSDSTEKYTSVKAVVDYITTVKASDETTANKVDAIAEAEKASTEKYTSNKAVVDYVAAEISDMQTKSNLETTIPASATASDEKYLSSKAVATALEAKEASANKISAIADGDKTSTDKYTSAKAVVDYVDGAISGKEDSSNKTQTVDKAAKSETKYTSEKAVAEFVATEISGKEDSSNKATSITDTNKASTTEYTSVKSVVDYVNDRLSAGVSYKVVDALPAVGDAEEGVIYLVPSESTATGNVKDEYMFINGAFEKIGTTQTDLDNYELLSNKKNTAVTDTTDTDSYYTAQYVNAELAKKVNTSDYLTTDEINTICDLDMTPKAEGGE